MEKQVKKDEAAIPQSSISDETENTFKLSAVGEIGISTKRQKRKSKSVALSDIFFELKGEDDRILEKGVYAILGAAREGKTQFAKLIEKRSKISRFICLEPLSTEELYLNTDATPIALTTDEIKEFFYNCLNNDDNELIIDSTRFLNSQSGFGLTSYGTPMIYNTFITELNNLALKANKVIFVVVSSVTNDTSHINLLEDMLIGSCQGVFKPKFNTCSCSYTLRSGDRTMQTFYIEDDFWKTSSQLTSNKRKEMDESKTQIDVDKLCGEDQSLLTSSRSSKLLEQENSSIRDEDINNDLRNNLLRTM